ncbi:MAG: response regulator [Betaproteobacteria bacterium]|nr:response regulator [Betaproteobacteria bacterium]
MAKTVLVVDDSASMRQIVSAVLIEAGYEVVTADDGASAMTLLDGRPLHLAICDVEMPHIDGMAFVAHMKQQPAYRFVPVIMLTTLWSDERKMQGRAVGAKAWFVKPFDPPKMLAAVARFILP